ncbi:hypothetical protein [Actinokineospora sp. HUAS TT18]|uniref:hypothetical protein n=1 Tax=Actinokineospora sp. HUAS TT18 TaxID=3447451 RepID=UPI003F51AD7D
MRFGALIPSIPFSTRTPRALVRVLAVAVFALAIMPAVGNQPAHAAVSNLTTAQRQAYLNYYAPVIFKRANEDNGQDGRDWLANFDFDQDGNFATNRLRWLESEHYVAASAAQATTSPYARWRIRPTLYTSLIEYTTGGVKSVVMLFHVYNAQDKEGSAIHDWERIEIVVRGVTGTPGAVGEYVNNSTITHHHEHIIRKRGDSGFNFMNTATGRHLMVWQADEAGSVLGTHAHELRYVNDSYSSLISQSVTNDAEVEISGKDENKNVHYIFVPQASSAAVSAWGAKPLTFANASTLIAGHDNEHTVDWYQAKRLTYELQDIADMIPTHWSQNPAWSTHWLSSAQDDVVLESPVTNEAGAVEVSTGRQRFYSKSRDNGASDLTDGREGLIHKGWLYGAYSAEADEDIEGSSDDFPAYGGTGKDSSGWTRQLASGRSDSPNSYWWQHDFFVHDGTVNTSGSTENGQWLRGAWYTAANGGFDGRWVQLFDDRAGQEAAIP